MVGAHTSPVHSSSWFSFAKFFFSGLDLKHGGETPIPGPPSRKSLSAQGAYLPSFHHPADQCSCGDAHRKGRRNSQHKVPLEALSCVIQEFLGGITALLCRTPHNSHTVLYRVGYRTGCARSLAS
ncbi:MAG: hypothetical protein WCA49_06850 [Candidatus Sulfotelmatobacter sp.]